MNFWEIIGFIVPISLIVIFIVIFGFVIGMITYSIFGVYSPFIIFPIISLIYIILVKRGLL